MLSLRLSALLALAALIAGCTTAKTSNTPRTATEQLLISNAVDQALDKVDFRPFAGRTVFLDEKYVDCIDKNYVIASIRHRLLANGAAVVASADAAEIVMEPRAGAVGTTTSESFLGVPEIALPGMLTLPEVRVLTRTQQEGTAKIGLVAYDTTSKQVLGPGGISLANADDSNWYVAGVGPWQTGSLKREMERGTSGRASWTTQRMPAFVSFDVPMETQEAPRQIQFTSGSKPTPAPAEEEPAAEEPKSPAWAN